MDLSIIVPVFNESRKIARDIEAASAFLMSHGLKGEIIIVDDGSGDGTSEAARAAQVSKEIQLRIMRYDPHRGKGFAVRTGIAASTGTYVMFADSGGCVPYHYALTALQMLKNGDCDIAHGSRKLKQSRIHLPQPWLRRAYSKFFRWFIIVAMKVPATLTDTQCGFKIYRGDVARELYGACRTDGFMFDVEIILRALQRQFRIKEFSIEWTADPDSRTTQTLDVKELLAELLMIKRL
jgi:dolichyl-phosphate beta-glucosyltransferase